MTDVTGFGLGGHLIELLRQSGVTAQLSVAPLPAYPTIDVLAQAGIVSTLLIENKRVASQLTGTAGMPAATLAVLFDPQTSGGLVAGVPAANAAACREDLRRAGLHTSL